MKRSSAARQRQRANRVALVALPLAGALLLAGCGGQGQTPPASSSNTATSSPTTTSPPSATSEPTTTAPTTDPNIPAAARAHTPAGAEAFVKYFYAQLNLAWSKPEAGLISVLSLPTCKTCLAFEGTAADLVAKRHHYRGDAFEVASVGSIGGSEVVVAGTQPPGAVVDSRGSVVKSRTKAQPIKFSVTLVWSSESWHINEIQVMQ